VCGLVVVNASNPLSYSRPSRFPETEKISPPLLQLSEVTFGYETSRIILNRINIDVGLESRIAIVGSNGSGKSTLCVSPRASPSEVAKRTNRIKLLTGELNPLSGQVNRNGRLRV